MKRSRLTPAPHSSDDPKVESVVSASPAYFREFVATLPADLVRSTHPRVHSDLATVAAARGSRPAVAGRFESSRSGQAGICVVADDRPGLLAAISAALVLSGLSVVHAAAYTRRTPARRAEAVDLFWVRRDDSTAGELGISDAALERFNRTLVDVVSNRIRLEDVSAVRPPQGAASYETRVRFIEDEAGTLATLEVETADRPGLLLALSRGLFGQRVQIVASRADTAKDGSVRDRFSLEELDGSLIGQGRRLAIQVAVMEAIGSLAH
jgi:[protein-PII] uridylyltransferase